MTCIDTLMKRHDLVTICDVTEHILPTDLAEEGLINYSIFGVPKAPLYCFQI